MDQLKIGHNSLICHEADMDPHQTLEGELANLELLEHLYQLYQNDPHQLHPSWKNYFQSLEKQGIKLKSTEYKKEAKETALPSVLSSVKDDRIIQLIDAYRTYGHLAVSINPIALKEAQEPFQLRLDSLGFQSSELDHLFPTYGLLDKKEAPLRELIQRLKSLYSHRVGVEYKKVVQNIELDNWIQKKIESGYFNQHLTIDQKKLTLFYLNKSELFESFLHTRYVGQKRFSLEGCETLIPMLALLIEKGAETDLKEVVVGMAHRGRLNVLSNILHKSYQEIFSEFEDVYIHESFEGTGDVKYHKGYAADFVLTQSGKKVKLTLPPNPSHLESVDPVVEGVTRAKQFINKDQQRKQVVPLLVHGDAALSGQGVIYETLQFCRLPGYKTGGTLHFVINNQIGFTTIPRDSRSTLYCTDIAKAFGSPVFHVNAEDPESCILAAFLALEIRQLFHCDVFIDLNGYRKYGHNESDEPAFTQPLEYQFIRKKKPIRELYRDELIQSGVVEREVAEKLEIEFKEDLQKVHEEVKSIIAQPKNNQFIHQAKDQDLFGFDQTGVELDTLKMVTERFSVIPPEFRPHPKLEHLIKDRLAMVMENKPIDWGMAEYLSYGTLLWEGVSIRISGQDSCRGTFSHRHAIWMDQIKEKEYFPLAHLKDNQGYFEIWNSPLSEFAVLGFDYGYSVANPQGLTIWEAQFGDFSNGAQVIIDQYIVSGEQKWGQQSGLVLLLPHGYEGQGPEHSSGRLERFLSLTGHHNIQVVNPTTPVQLFHLLRRQALRPLHKPLVVFTPKGLLRYTPAFSRLEEFVQSSFQEILDDPTHPQSVQRLIFCTGRIYYDLIAEREKLKSQGVALVRIEQLYPLDKEGVQEIIHRYGEAKECLWVQEEPLNMGSWHFIRSHLEALLPSNMPLSYVGRPVSASPATGSHVRHQQEHANILKQVFQYEK